MPLTSGNLTRRLVFAGLLVSLAGPNWAIAQSFCRYSISAVIEGPSCGILGPAGVDLLAINDLGQACGTFQSCATGQDQPFAWSKETGLVILPLPPGVTHGEAVSINNVLGSDGLGQIACTLIAGAHRAYLYDDGVWTLLPPEPGGLVSIADSVNDHGQVLGWRSNSGSFLWQDGMFTDLISEPGATGRDLNQPSQVCGDIGFPTVGFLWDAGIVDELPLLPRAVNSIAWALNLRELIVGYSLLQVKEGQPATHLAWLHEFRQLTPIPPPPEYLSTLTVDVNDANQILVEGRTPPVFLEMYLYQNGELVKVEDLVNPQPDILFGGDVTSINNRGQIGGEGFTARSHVGVILTPVDRPLGDVNIDCAVDGHDLTMILNQWGPCPQVGSCLCDIVSRATFQPPGDGMVDAADLAAVLGNWTVTPSGSAPPKRR